MSKSKKSSPKTKISPARKAAFSILLKLNRTNADSQSHSDDLLRSRAVSALSSADRNLTTTLVLGVLRWQLTLDAQIRPLLARPNAKLDAEVLIALRLGAYQLLHLDRIPSHAAIAESVELTRHAGHQFATGMVNAVLRKLADGRAQSLTNASAIAAHPATMQAHPVWMVERWKRFYGDAATEAICKHGQQQPALTVRLADPDVANEMNGVELSAGALLTAARTLLAGEVTSTDAFRTGRLRIQDEGSQLVAELAAAALTPQRSSMILDCCAAPGGKTLIFAERNPLAHIVACDASPQRLEQMRQRIAEFDLQIRQRIECLVADATLPDEESLYDLVLADVPCSGTGTLGRNPEIRYRLSIDDLNRQAERQRLILINALRSVRPGGLVFYSTCSIEPEENEQVVASVVEEMNHQNKNSVQRVSLAAPIQALSDAGRLIANVAEQLNDCLTPQGNLILLPGKFSTDGFFISAIQRN